MVGLEWRGFSFNNRLWVCVMGSSRLHRCVSGGSRYNRHRTTYHNHWNILPSVGRNIVGTSNDWSLTGMDKDCITSRVALHPWRKPDSKQGLTTRWGAGLCLCRRSAPPVIIDRRTRSLGRRRVSHKVSALTVCCAVGSDQVGKEAYGGGKQVGE